MNLGPRYLPRRTKTRSKLGDPQTMQNRLHRWTSRGPPLCGCKNGSKTTILNKGLNEEQLAWNFAILVLMVGPVKPATSPRIRRSTSISHKSLGPWDQVFNHRGSRRDWPKDMWICLALFGHCSRTQVFQPLPSLQLLVPFHLPGHGAKRGRQQDRVISAKLDWSYN